MPFRYNKLWKLLIEQGMNKTDLMKATGISSSTMAKLGKNEAVSLSVLAQFCEYFQCDFSDLIEDVPEKRE